MVHYGEYVLQEVMGREKPNGSCVNLAHRLLKNTVSETTGWRGYLLCSEESMRQMQVWPNAMHAVVETYAHLGEVQTYSMNLDLRHAFDADAGMLCNRRALDCCRELVHCYVDFYTCSITCHSEGTSLCENACKTHPERSRRVLIPMLRLRLRSACAET